VLKGAWGIGSIVSFGSPLGGNGSVITAGKMFCGSFTLTRLVNVAFFSFVVDLDALTNLARCEASKVFLVAFVDCLYQHGDNWII
jgi:hypothetical protein